MILVGTSPAIISPAPIQARNVMVWGDQSAQEAMWTTFEAKGWTWATLVLGEQTPALLLTPPSSVADVQITAIINDVNAGKYGKLNGGYGTIGAPETQSGSNKS